MQASQSFSLQYLINPDHYLLQNVIHICPLSARTNRLLNNQSNYLQNLTSTDKWHGHLIRVLIKGTILSGLVLNFAVAHVEIITASIFGIIGTSIIYATNSKSERLQKYTLKCISYVMHSGLIIGYQLYQIYRFNKSRSNYMNNIIHNSLYLCSTIATHSFFGKLFNQHAKRENIISNISNSSLFLLRCLVEHIKYLFKDVIENEIGEIGEIAEIDINEWISSLSLDGLPNYLIHLETINNLTISNLIDENYRNLLYNLIEDLLVHFNLMEIDSDEVIISFLGVQDKLYQQKLHNFVKEAFIEVYRDNSLNIYFDDENESIQGGKEALLEGYPNIFIPLALMAQLKELEADTIVCPETFEGSQLIIAYKTRYEEVKAASKDLKALMPNEKSVLIQKLLKAESVTLDQKLQDLYLKICKLGGDLHQGKLMSQETMSLSDLNFSSNHLFQKAILEAVQEISRLDRLN